MNEHKVSCTDELVTKRYGTFPGTVARCICGWKVRGLLAMAPQRRTVHVTYERGRRSRNESRRRTRTSVARRRHFVRRSLRNPRRLRLVKAQMTNHQQAAVEAALALFDEGEVVSPVTITITQQVIAAAEPHLRKKWAEEVRALSIGDIENIEDCLRHEPEVCDLCRGREQAAKLLEGAGE